MKKFTIQVSEEEFQIISEGLNKLNSEWDNNRRRIASQDLHHYANDLHAKLSKLKNDLNHMWNNRCSNEVDALLNNQPQKREFNVTRLKQVIQSRIDQCDRKLNSRPSNDLEKLISVKKLGLKLALKEVEAEEGLINGRGESIRSVIMQGAPRE